MSKMIKMYLVFLVLLAMNFRLLLASLIGGGSRFIIIFGFGIMFYICISELNLKKYKSHFTNFFFVGYIISLIFYGYTVLFAKDILPTLDFLLQRSYSTVLASVLIMFAFGNISTSRIIWILDRLSIILLPATSVLFIVNNYFRKHSFELYRTEDIIKNVFKFEGQLINQRTLGMMINLENSAVAIAMVYVYFTYRFIVSRILTQRRVSKMAVLIFGLGTFGVLTTTSLSVILVCFGILGVCFISSLYRIGFQRLKQKKSLILFPVLVFGAIIYLRKYIFNLSDRILTYIQDPQILFANVYLEKGDHWADFFFNTRIHDLKSSGFGINEMHVFLSMSYMGILPSLIWYVVFFSIVFFFFFLKRFDERERAVYGMMAAAFISGLHYAGVTSWPNNVLYFLGFAVLGKRILRGSSSQL